MMSRVVLFLLPLMLSSCSAPCTSPASRELLAVDRLIAETRANLGRGYAYAPPAGQVNFCVGGADNGVGLSLCTDASGRGNAVPVDPASERRKLAELEQRAAGLRAAVARDRAACAR